jgi:hypothetical protein
VLAAVALIVGGLLLVRFAAVRRPSR